MKKLVAVAPREAALKEYEDREILSNEVKVQVEFAAPKHGTELADFRGTTPFIDGKFDEEWRVFAKRDEEEPRGIEFGDLPLGNMFVGTITEKGADVTEYEIGDRVCSYGPIKETQIVNAVDNYKLRKMSKDASTKNAVCYDLLIQTGDLNLLILQKCLNFILLRDQVILQSLQLCIFTLK